MVRSYLPVSVSNQRLPAVYDEQKTSKTGQKERSSSNRCLNNMTATEQVKDKKKKVSFALESSDVYLHQIVAFQEI